jgi:predicted transcriptional regulator
MAKSAKRFRLAAGEIEILEMLWRAGPATLAEAHRALGQAIGYTTVQTRLNRLVTKKLVARSHESPARYSAAISSEDVSAQDLNLLVSRVSGGRVIPLVAHLIRDRLLDRDEIAALKQLIADAEKKSKRG